MVIERRWRRHERDARIANRFEREQRGYRALNGGLAVHMDQMQSPGFTQSHLQEAYELGRREQRRGD